MTFLKVPYPYLHTICTMLLLSSVPSPHHLLYGRLSKAVLFHPWKPQPQSSPPTEGTSVQVLAHSVCGVTVLNNNVTNTLNYTVISMMKIMSTVNCLGSWLLCSPCWEVQLLKAVLHDNIAKILIARQGDEWQACAAQLKLFQFTLSVKFAVYNKHLCLLWRE